MSDTPVQERPRLPPQFARLAELPAGWDSYGAPAIDTATIQRACAWLAGVHVVPTSEGGVQLEWARDGWCIEVCFRADGLVDAFAGEALATDTPRPPGDTEEK